VWQSLPPLWQFQSLFFLGTIMGVKFTDAELLAESETEDGHRVFTYMTPDRTMRYLPDIDAQGA